MWRYPNVFPVLVPVLIFGTELFSGTGSCLYFRYKNFWYRFLYLFSVPNFPSTGSSSYFRYQLFRYQFQYHLKKNRKFPGTGCHTLIGILSNDMWSPRLLDKCWLNVTFFGSESNFHLITTQCCQGGKSPKPEIWGGRIFPKTKSFPHCTFAHLQVRIGEVATVRLEDRKGYLTLAVTSKQVNIIFVVDVVVVTFVLIWTNNHQASYQPSNSPLQIHHWDPSPFLFQIFKCSKFQNVPMF